MTQPGSYSFVPWFRQGVATGIRETDDPKDASTKGRPSIDAALTLRATPLSGTNPVRSQIGRTVSLLGPGDVATLKTQAVLRVHPAADARDATPGELAYVEFYDEDLPWRYTPAKPATVTVGATDYTHLRPWIALLVLAQGEYEVNPHAGGRLAVTVAAGTPLPPSAEHWAWAHAQLAGDSVTVAGAGAAVAADPDAALSRLVSPRRLRPGVRYAAFVVPAFETGRLAGLGQDPGDTPTMRPSWPDDGGTVILPVYYAWQFTTGTDGSFESYVRRLAAYPVDDSFGMRPVSVDLSAYPIAAAGPATVQLEGALRPPEFGRAEFADTPTDPLAAPLADLLDLAVSRLEPGAPTGGDPGIVPPVYGRWHAGVTRLGLVPPAVPPPAGGTTTPSPDDVSWIRELNLDLRERAGAGLGAQVVRDRQDDLIARAWAQVGSLHDVNQRLREAEVAVAASGALFQKHFEPVAEDELFLLSAATHHGLRATPPAEAAGTGTATGTAGPGSTGTGGTGTATGTAGTGGTGTGGTGPGGGPAAPTGEPVPSLRAAVDASAIPSAVQDGAFKRLTRPATPLVRRAFDRSRSVATLRAGLVAGLNDGTVTAAPPVPAPAASISLTDLAAAVGQAATAAVPKTREPKHIFWQMLVAELVPPPPPQPPATPPPWVLPSAQTLGANVHTRFAAWRATNPVNSVTVDAVGKLADNITSVAPQPDGTVTVGVGETEFKEQFGKQIAGKSGAGITILCDPAPADIPPLPIARFADDDAAERYGDTVAQMSQDIAARQAAVPVKEPLADLTRVNTGLHGALRPADTLVARVTSALPGFAAAAAQRAAARARRLQPVLAYPVFPDAMVAALQAIDREYVLPNMGALPADTLTLMTPNGRFIEAFLAGLNTQMARELLWQEYPTDQRGSYFRVFWSRDDAVGSPATDDIAEIPAWTGPLGSHGTASAQPLVLVVRSELLRKFPHTLVYAQPAKFTDTGGHTLDTTAAPVYPSFHATLDPDVTLVGFDFSDDTARGRAATEDDPGDPGMFFVLAERPGQLRFGLDDTGPTGPLATWDNLSWAALTNSDDHIEVDANAPTATAPGVWGATSADMAVILFRSPVMYARHAATMLPEPPPTAATPAATGPDTGETP